MDVVVTRFNESIDWTNNLPYTLFIYNKGFPHLKQNVIQTLNYGREADSMLLHIIQRYNCLSETTAFLQANPFDHCWNVLQLLEKHQHNKEVVWLGSNWGPITKRFDGGPGNANPFPVLEMCHKLFGDCGYDTNTQFTFSAGAQYIVPKNYIHNKSLEWWQHAYSVFRQFFCLSHYGHKNSAPWVFERIWPLIWNYSTNQTSYVLV